VGNVAARNAVRDADALMFRAQGWTFDRIAAEMGYANRSGAIKAVERAIAESARETREAAQALIAADLMEAKREAWGVLRARHVTIQQGKIVGRFAGFARDPDTGETVRDADDKPIALYEEIDDDAPVLAAVDRIVKIDQELAKIFGAYAPVRHEVRTIDEIDARLIDLAEGMGGVVPAAKTRLPRQA
jgi:hypothetical protein